MLSKGKRKILLSHVIHYLILKYSFALQNSISEKISQKQVQSPTEICYQNGANITSQASINPSEDDTNIYPPSSASFLPGEEISSDPRRIPDNRYFSIFVIVLSY